MPEPFDAVILAGGSARRLGGMDKPGLEVGGVPLVERVAAAVAAARATVVVGPERERPEALYLREDPPGSGPVAALSAGAARVTAPWFALLAGDMPFLVPEHVEALRRAAFGAEGAVLVDAAGHPQWLASLWRTSAVAGALADYRGGSLRGLFAPLRFRRVQTEAAAVSDCDTPEDLRRARDRAGPE